MVFHRLSASNPKRYRRLYLLIGVAVAILLVVLLFRLYPM
jgi:hypothetical protein